MSREIDYPSARERMVSNQLIPRGIKDERVLDVMRTVPRHLFIPADLRTMAYADAPLPIGNRQTISQPYIVALMTELLELEGKERILEIGTGSGYQAAILAYLAEQVYTVERISELAENAQKVFQELEIVNIQVFERDGSLGLPEFAPFDAIMVTAAAPKVPVPLQEQLADLVGVTRQTIGLIEAGKYNPTLKLCLAMSRVLGKGLDELFWIGDDNDAKQVV